MTNKGIVKRAYKDFEGITFEVENGIDEIKINFDDITVTLKENLPDSTCTCPSRSICKHIITAVLYTNQAGEISTESTPAQTITTNIDEVLSTDQAPLFKAISAVALKHLYADIANNRLPVITESNFITVELADGNRVRILTPIKNTVCSCKSNDMCKHKALAILYYIASKNALEIKTEQSIKNADINTDQIQLFARRIKQEVCDIMTVGLSRISISITEHCEKLSLSSHNLGLARHQNLFRELSAMYTSYFERDVHFSESLLLKKLSDIYSLAQKLETENDLTKLTTYMGTFREEYIDAPTMSFFAIGDRYVETMSGYAGNCYYFFEENSKQVYSYSELRPTFYDTNRQNSYTPPNLMWNFNISMKNLVAHRFTLTNPKISADRRLSSSTQITGSLQEELGDNLPISSDLVCTDYRKLISMEEKCENDKVAFVMTNEVASYGFDTINKIFNMVITDENSYPIYIELKQTKANEPVINILNAFCKRSAKDTLFVGIVYPDNGKLKMLPLEYFKGFIPIDKKECD